MSQASQSGRQLTVSGGATTNVCPCEVHVSTGLIDSAGTLVATACPATRYAIISDTQVANLYGERLLASLADQRCTADLFPFPAGEWNKTRETWAELTDRLLRAGIGGGAALVALGGGVTLDLTGFLGATYLAGLPLVRVPTTLAAMLAGSVGGTVALDTAAGKNLLAATCQPVVVLIDPAVLSTLPVPQLAAGLAEAFRHGLVLDSGYFDRLADDLEAVFAREPQALCEVVWRSLELRAEVLNRAAGDRDYQQVLEFGSMVGRTLETVMGYGWLPGETLAVGLVTHTVLGEALGVTRQGTARRVREVLAAARLPVAPEEDLDPERFGRALELERKRRGGEPRYVLIREIGQVAKAPEGGWEWEAPEEAVRGAVFEALEPGV